MCKIFVVFILTLGTSLAFPTDDFKCPKAEGYFKHPTDRHKFYECHDYVAFLFTCPADLVFDEKKTACVFDDSPTPAPTDEPTQAPTEATTEQPTDGTTESGESTTASDKFVCPEPNGFFKDPEDKHNFYHCINGIATKQTCPKGFVWHSRSLSCILEEDFDEPDNKF